ncbi:unnamed protein product, partial [Callosobruchus maculatus]
MYPDGTNRHYTIKKMFNRSNAENAENAETECFFSRQSLTFYNSSCEFVLGTVLYA